MCTSSSLLFLCDCCRLVGFFVGFEMHRSKCIHKTKRGGRPIDPGHGKMSLHDCKKEGGGVRGLVIKTSTEGAREGTL